jgi:hypothetical protein
VDVLLRVLPADITGVDHELTEKGSHLLYIGSAETPVRFRLLESGRLRAGEVGAAQLHLRDHLLLARGDRFVLRDAGRILTFGGGVIADPLPNRARRGDEERIRLIERLPAQAPHAALRILLEHEGRIDAAEALLRSGAPEASEELKVGSDLFSEHAHHDLIQRVRAVLERHHREKPLE